MSERYASGVSIERIVSCGTIIKTNLLLTLADILNYSEVRGFLMPSQDTSLRIWLLRNKFQAFAVWSLQYPEPTRET